MQKKILVIGAGFAQADGIQKARDMGLYVLASDASAAAPGLKIAHESRVIDVTDIEKNLEWARQSKVNGVISFASDITLPAVLAIREELGLPGTKRNPVEISLDKGKQRQIFKAAGLPQPVFEIISSWEDLQKAAPKLGFPLVVKPVDSSGSRGVTILEDALMLQAAYKEAKEASKSGLVIAEQFMEGKDLTIDGFTIDNQHHILAISEKYKPKHKYPVARYLVFPAPIADDDEAKIIDLLKDAYNAVGVDQGPTHAEIMLTAQGPKITEIACRGGGFFVFTRIVEAVSGYDEVANWIKMCVGDQVEIPTQRLKRGAVLKFYEVEAGRLAKVSGLEAARAISGVETDLFIKAGETIQELRNGGRRPGWMIAYGETRQEAVHKANQVDQLVKFEVEALP